MSAGHRIVPFSTEGQGRVQKWGNARQFQPSTILNLTSAWVLILAVVRLDFLRFQSALGSACHAPYVTAQPMCYPVSAPTSVKSWSQTHIRYLTYTKRKQVWAKYWSVLQLVTAEIRVDERKQKQKTTVA